MMKTILLAAAMISVAACGDDKKQPDAPRSIDAPPIDSPNVPTPPTLGAQIDRMGRPAINTALNHVLDTSAATKTPARDMYNQDQATGSWQATYTPEFAKNLAVFDALDKGLGAAAGTGNACGNQAEYNGAPGGDVGNPMQCFSGTTYQAGCSYGTLAGILADDQLYLDTTKTRCKAYLAVEFSVVTTMPNTDCGGRAPDNDVMDTSYSVLAAGISGFNLMMDPPAPLVGDGVSAHTDYTDTFPFFGMPH